ncbi:MAG: DEAD/DEAH box helicase [Candidatus Eremiobacteraeota bacterium]|nr:DEAD/DEAH box helicase [Candidatus Eremiobacteraeota bacterium]
MRTHAGGDAGDAPATAAGDSGGTNEIGSLEWLPAAQTATDATARARSVWPVFSLVDGKSLVCALFLDTPRLRGVRREAEAIASMLEQTPSDDWDDGDRALFRDGTFFEAFGARPNGRALAQAMFRLVRHPRVRYDDAPEQSRHPSELPQFAIDPRGVRAGATFHGSEPQPAVETLDGRRIDLRSAVTLEGPPGWLADARGAYLLEATFDVDRAAKAIEAARNATPQPPSGKPALATIARVAAYLSPSESRALGIEEALEPSPHLTLAWSAGALVARAALVERSGALAELAPRTVAQGAVAACGERLVRFAPEATRGLAERLVGAGFVPRGEGTFALHGAERAALFVRETLPDWTDAQIRIDRSLESVHEPDALDLSVGARRFEGSEDWFELDVGVFFRDGERVEALTPEERSALFAGSGRYAEIRGRLVDVGKVRERQELLDDLLARQKTGLAALLALRDEIHAALGAGSVRLPDEVEALRERVRSFNGIAHVTPPSRLGGVLRHYQELGLDFLAYLAEFRFGGILADEMGTGKTLATLAYLSYRKERDGAAPSLVIAPTSVVHAWENEIARFTPELSVLTLHSGNERAALFAEIDCYDVVITSYALARLDAEKLGQTRFRTIVLDEAQNAKNPSSQISKVVRTLRAEHRLALTGTPVENSLRDLWAIFAFLEPGLLGNETAFRRRFEIPVAAGDRRAADALHARLEPFVLRRTKEEVAPELPERTEVEIVVDLSPAQKALYRTIAEAARREIFDVWDSEGEEKTNIHVLAALTRLRQVCAHPGLLSERYLGEPEASGKFDALLETIDEILDGRHKVLVFSSFASMLRIVRDELQRRELAFAYLDGSTKEAQRRTEVARFMDPGGPPVFLCSLKAGGVGLTLTAADYVILYDPWWNPAVERQAIDRTHRIGQHRAVTAYRLLARGTVEEKIRALAARKRELSDAVIRSDAAMAKTLSRADLEFLLADPI